MKLRRRRLSGCFKERLRFKLRPIALPKAVHMTGSLELRKIISKMIRSLKRASSLDINTLQK